MHNFDRYLDPRLREEFEENSEDKKGKKKKNLHDEEKEEEEEASVLEHVLRAVFRHFLLLATIMFILLLVMIEPVLPVLIKIITPSLLIKIFGLIIINAIILYIYGRLISVPNLKFGSMVECSIPVSLVIMITGSFNLFFRVLISVIANIMFFFIGFEYNVGLEKMFSLNGYIILADLFFLYGIMVFLG
jgi:hypothetical protein